MPLDSQLVQVDFTGGLDQRMEARHVVPGKLTGLVNGRFDRVGSIRKRPGTVTIASTSNGAPLAAGQGMLAPYKDELLLIDGVGIHSYSPSQGEFINKDEAIGCALSEAGIADGALSTFDFDLAVGGGYVAYVYSNAAGLSGTTGTGEIFITVRDQTTGAEVYSGVLSDGSATSSFPKVKYASGGFVVTWVSSTFVRVLRLTPPVSTGSWTKSATSSPITNNATCGLYELEVLGTQIVVLYQRPSDGAMVAGVYDAAAFTVVTTIVVFDGTDTKSGMAISATVNETLWLAWSTTPAGTQSMRLAAYNAATFASVLAPTTLYSSNATAFPPSGSMTLVRVSAAEVAAIFNCTSQGAIGSGGSGVGGTCIRAGRMTTAGTKTVDPSNRETYWSQLCSKAFTYGGRYYAWAYVGIKGSQFSCVCLDLGLHDTSSNYHLVGKPVAMTAARIAAPTNTSGGTTISSVGILSSTQQVFATRQLRSASGRSGLVAATLDWAEACRWGYAEMGDSISFAGALTTTYDGSTLSEAGFTYFPYGAGFTAVAGSLPAGQYNYIFTYFWVDARGQIHESAPSPLGVAPHNPPTAGDTWSSGICTGTPQAIQIQIPAYTVTLRQDHVNQAGVNSPTTSIVGVNVYRSLATSPSGPFYRVLQDYTTLQSSSQNELVTFTDNHLDSEIATHPTLYTGQIGTSNAIVDNVAPPGFRSIVGHKGRLFGIHPNGREVWFTKSTVLGEATASKWADEFTIPFEETTRLTALASMDDKLIAFSRNRIYVIFGDGPTDGDLNNDYGVPQRSAADVGCIDPRSVLSYSEGVTFLSAVGLHLLTRSLDTEWKGREVQSIIDTNEITAATIHPSDSFILFGTRPPGATTGTRVMFDVNVNEWGTDVLQGVARAGAAVVSSCSKGGQYYWLDADGNVYGESPTSYLDGTTWVPLTVETAWIKLAGLQGFQRAWMVSLLGEYYTSHDLTLSVGTDYDSVYRQVHTFPATVLDTLTLEQLQLRVVRQLCQAIRVKVTDASPTGGVVGSGRGVSLNGVAVEIGVNKHIRPGSPAKRG